MKQPNYHKFQDVAKDPFFWFIQADDLYSAGLALLESAKEANDIYVRDLPKESGRVKLSQEQQQASRRLRLPMVSLMLFGMAFETALKGIIIARRPDLVTEKMIAQELTRGDHSLTVLFEKATIPVSESEKYLLDHLSESIRWAGRYPVPKKESLHRFKKLPIGGIIFPGTPLPKDKEEVSQLWCRIVEVIQNDPAIPKYTPC